MIATTAPLIGLAAIGFWFAVGWGEFSLGYIPFRSAVPVAYYLGGVQSALAGIMVGWAIWRRGWVSLAAWMTLTGVLAMLPVLVLLTLPGKETGNAGLIYVSNFNIACYLIAAALVASTVLRILIIAMGVMRQPSAER